MGAAITREEWRKAFVGPAADGSELTKGMQSAFLVEAASEAPEKDEDPDFEKSAAAIACSCAHIEAAFLKAGSEAVMQMAPSSAMVDNIDAEEEAKRIESAITAIEGVMEKARL